jgi:hypothetical protein
MFLKLKTQILASSVRTKMLDLSNELIFDLFLKFLELFKGFRFMLHQIDISISTQIISKGHEVMMTIARSDAHWSTHIRMYDSQMVGCPLKQSDEQSLSHFA